METRTSFTLALGLFLGAAATTGLSAQVINAVTCGGARCPEPLELVNGETVTVTLTGERLDELVSGMVSVGRFRPIPISEVSVELASTNRRIARSLTIRQVMLTARGAAERSGLDLRFTTSDRRSVRAPLQLAIAAVTTAPGIVAPQDPNDPISDPNRTLTTVEGSLPSISSAIPSSIDLSSGAPAVVVLQGTNLGSLEEAVVVLDGAPVRDVTAQLQPASSDGTRRDVLLTATVTGSTPYNVPLTLRVSAGSVRTAIAAPVNVQVVVPVARIDEGSLFGGPIEQVIAGAWGPQTFFRSCGPPSTHGFQIGLPVAGYSASGDMIRFERDIGFMSGDWIRFGEDHTLDGTDLITGEIADLPKSAHPSPVAHSVSGVRMCLVHQFMKPWVFAGTVERNGTPHLIVRVPFDRLLFKARGMPAHVTGVPGTAVGIGWGDDVTDTELPDYEWSSPVYDILLPLDLRDGRLRYGTPVLVQRVARRWWSSDFLGPASIRDRMVQYSRDRVEQIGQAILEVFDASVTRSKISDAIASNLQNVHGVDRILSLKPYSGDLWEVAHP